MPRWFSSCRAPVLCLGALLGATALAGPALIRETVHADLERSAASWLAAEGLADVTVSRVDGQDIVLRGPANQMNSAIELMYRNRSNQHWIENVAYSPTANPTTTTAAPSTTAGVSTVATTATTAAPTTAAPATAAPTTEAPATTVPPLTTVPTSATTAAASTCPQLPSLTGVAFETSSARLTTAAQNTLNGVADTLKSAPDCSIEIIGHTDSRGDAAANQELSFNRASAVRQYLVERGVNPDKLTASGLGESNLKVSPETNDEDRAANRRIEFKPTNTGS